MHLIFVGAVITVVGAALFTLRPELWVWALALIWLFLFGLLNYDHVTDRKRILKWVKRPDNAGVYTKLVDAMMGGLQRMLSPTDAARDPMPAKGRMDRIEWLWTPRARDPKDLARLQKSTFSWPVLDAAWKLAVMYPLVLLLVQWGITGADTGIGAAPILGAEERVWLRAGIVIPLVAFLGVHLLASASQISGLRTASKWLFFIAVAGYFAGHFAGAGVSADSNGLTVAAAVLFGVKVTVTVTMVVSIAVAFAMSVAFGVTFAGFVVFAGTLAFALAALAVVGYGCAKGKGVISYTIYVIGLWAACVLAFSFFAEGISPDRRVLAFAFGLLPLINAVFDYVSYGTTLALIRKGRQARNWVTGAIWILDGIAALALLIGLGLGLCGTIALINHLAGQDFIALRPIFDDLKTPEERVGYSWLVVSMLTTLVPTLVHLALAFLSAFTWVPLRFKSWIASGIENDEAGDLGTLGGSFVAATLGALYAGVVAFGLWGILLFVMMYLEPVGLWVLAVVETLAVWFGWLPPGATAPLGQT